MAKKKIFSDPWLPRPGSFRPITRPNFNVEDWRVNMLLSDNDRGWN